jgi:6-phosphogluconolactonase
MHAPSAPVLWSFSNPDELVGSLAQFVIKAQKEAVQRKGRFTVAVSGGSLPKQLKGLIDNPDVRWDRWYSGISPLMIAHKR